MTTTESLEAMSLDELKAERDRREVAWREAQAMIRRRIIESAEFKIGDVVMVGAKRAKVRRVDAPYGDVQYVVSFERKNGGWMDRESQAWSFQHITAADPTA
jgi:hypothetical protein